MVSFGVWASWTSPPAHFAIAKNELKLLEAEVAKLDKAIGTEQLQRITSIISNIYGFFPRNLMDA